MTPSSTVVPFAPGPVSNGLFTRSNHDDYRQLLQQGLNLVQQCLQRQQQPFSGILPQELAADCDARFQLPECAVWMPSTIETWLTLPTGRLS